MAETTSQTVERHEKELRELQAMITALQRLCHTLTEGFEALTEIERRRRNDD